MKRAFESSPFQPKHILHAKYKTESFIWKIILSGYQTEGQSAFFYSRQLFKKERYADSKGERERVRENTY